MIPITPNAAIHPTQRHLGVGAAPVGNQSGMKTPMPGRTTANSARPPITSGREPSALPSTRASRAMPKDDRDHQPGEPILRDTHDQHGGDREEGQARHAEHESISGHPVADEPEHQVVMVYAPRPRRPTGIWRRILMWLLSPTPRRLPAAWSQRRTPTQPSTTSSLST